MTIRIYPSTLPGAPLETHEWSGTIAGFFLAQGIDYAAQEVQPVVIVVNGVAVPVSQWQTTAVAASDEVEIRIVARGGVISAIGNIVSKVFNIAFGWLLPKTKTTTSSYAQGDSLETATATANTAKLNGVVPELLGRFRRYPDYLTPPRRRFLGPREQWLEFLACIGPGEYRVEADSVKVGDTAFASLGDDAEYVIFAPGADVSGSTAHENWYSNAEVGGTSSGTAGLELTTDEAPEASAGAAAYQFAGINITIPDGMGAWPADWVVGSTLNISLPLDYAVTRENIGTELEPEYANVFEGDFTETAPAVGDELTLTGAVSGTYRVHTVESATRITLEFLEGGVLDSVTPATYSLAVAVPESQYTITAVSGQTIAVTRTVGSSWPGWPSVQSSNATITFDGSAVAGEWSNAYAACPESETTTTFEVDLFCPQGLGKANNSGGVDGRSVTVEIQYRDARVGGSYATASRTYTQATLDQIGFTERITVATAIRPEVRIRRIGAKSDDTQIQDEVQWYGLRALLATPTSYAGWTTIAVRLRGGGKLSAQSENQVNLVATRILPTLQSSGAWGTAVPTSDISAAIGYIARTIGYTDDNLDLSELLRLHDVWSARGETLDYVFDETTVKEAIETCLTAGMAELTLDDGKIKPVRDDVRTVFEQSYSSQNTTGGIVRAFSAPAPDDNDGVQVKFVDAADSWAEKTLDCVLPGSAGAKLESLTLNGVTDETRAWRIGMRRARDMRYRRWSYSFTTELDALNSSYGSYVALVADRPGLGQSSILAAVSGAVPDYVLTVTEPLTWTEGADHVAAWRRPDGSLAGPFAAVPGADVYTLNITAATEAPPSPTLRHEPPHVYFGPVDRWTCPALITQISPSGMDSVKATAKNYDARVYADDDNSPS